MSYNLQTSTWTTLNPTGTRPTARMALGFSEAADGNIYLYGGIGEDGNLHFFFLPPVCNFVSLQYLELSP
jgi:hypothetical protein